MAFVDFRRKTMEKPSSVKLRIGGHEIELEGPAEHVAAILRGLLLAPSPKLGTENSPPGTPPETPHKDVSSGPSMIDIRQFFQEKKPSKDIEAVATVAYYYQFIAPPAERRETIDVPALKAALHLAKYPLPPRADASLANAKKAGYLGSGAQRGEYRLTTVGHNLVAHRLGIADASSNAPHIRVIRRKKQTKRR